MIWLVGHDLVGTYNEWRATLTYLRVRYLTLHLTGNKTGTPGLWVNRESATNVRVNSPPRHWHNQIYEAKVSSFLNRVTWTSTHVEKVQHMAWRAGGDFQRKREAIRVLSYPANNEPGSCAAIREIYLHRRFCRCDFIDALLFIFPFMIERRGCLSMPWWQIENSAWGWEWWSKRKEQSGICRWFIFFQVKTLYSWLTDPVMGMVNGWA